MVRRLVVLVLAFAATLLTAACELPDQPYGYATVEDVPPATCTESYRRTFDASEWTEAAERDQLTKAASEWYALSGGQISITISFEPASGKPLHRVHASDDVVKNEESKQETQPYVVFGWETNDEEVFLVVDAVPTEELHTLAAHELGHAAGLAWPYCLAGREKCHHSPDPRAVMAPQFNGGHALTPSDLALCRASCLCP